MKKWRLYIILLLCSHHSFGQISANDAKRIENTLYNILDKNVGQMFSFTKVDKYLDGTPMDISKCDDIIYIKYENEYFKRNYEGELNIRWFGGSESVNDNQNVINKILVKYKTAYVPQGIFKFSGTITVPENAVLSGSGKSSVLKLVSKHPIDGISLYRWGTLKSFKLDCTETDLDVSSAILINAWNNVKSNTGELKIRDLQITGNYPQLQGVAIKLQAKPDATHNYSIINFCKFYDIDIYGFRDGIFCDLQYGKGKNISYINANIFDNIFINNCLRPVRLINTADEADILSGKSNISSNFFRNIIIQHAVGNYPAVYLDGASNNEINAQLIDWRGLYFEASPKSRSNVMKSLPDNPAKTRVIKPSKKVGDN